MHSYIKVHHFEPQPEYKPIEKLFPFIDKTMNEQRVSAYLNEQEVKSFRAKIINCLKVYYRLVGIDEAVIAGKGSIEPKGVLPRYTESLMAYFQMLETATPANEEIAALKYSGVDTIKIRYKYTDSVIKKLVKLGLRNPKVLEEPLKIFLKDGALHDLIGMLFVCSYPYEKEWVARVMYYFFSFPHRTDDHLIYGFYTVEKKSGYRGLHCDHTLFNPKFDFSFLCAADTPAADPDSIFELLNPEDGTIEILSKLKAYFNVEIQLHTTFENLWSSMEHTNNYNIQAKGLGRNSKITVQWKLLSDTMKNLEEQFEQLQVETEQVRFEDRHHGGYIPAKEFFGAVGSDAYPIYAASSKRVEELEELLGSHEISRQDYVLRLRDEISKIDHFSSKISNPAIQTIFRIQSALIYYGLANQGAYFNAYDIRQFVKEAMKRYSTISTFLSSHPDVYKGNLLNIITIFRYLYLAQKYGMGLFNPPKDIFAEKDNPVANYSEILSLFETGLSLLNHLTDEDIAFFAKDNAAFIKIIYHYDLMAREWELFNDEDDSLHCAKITRDITLFRKRFVTDELMESFKSLLESNIIKNIGFVVKFYTTMVWHGFLEPIDALRQIIKYSAYDKIKASELFYYELSAYRSLLVKTPAPDEQTKINHLKHYHQKNMIQLLFRIKKRESVYKFYECRLYFEKITESKFKIDHFSDTIHKGE